MPDLVRKGHLYLAQPPLYRLTAGTLNTYARDDAHRAELEASVFKGRKVEVGRFKGLGKMNPEQLKRDASRRPPKVKSGNRFFAINHAKTKTLERNAIQSHRITL